MGVVKVIWEGELPNGCLLCDLARYWHFGKSRCHATGKTIWTENKTIRPDWCPLVTKQHYIDELFAELEKLIPLISNKKYEFVSGEYNENSGTIPSVESKNKRKYGVNYEENG